jgi:hypothetical protein
MNKQERRREDARDRLRQYVEIQRQHVADPEGRLTIWALEAGPRRRPQGGSSVGRQAWRFAFIRAQSVVEITATAAQAFGFRYSPDRQALTVPTDEGPYIVARLTEKLCGGIVHMRTIPGPLCENYHTPDSPTGRLPQQARPYFLGPDQILAPRLSERPMSARHTELARILRDVAERVESGVNSGGCRDVNGNTVGRFQQARRRVRAGMTGSYLRSEFAVTICTDNAAFHQD